MTETPQERRDRLRRELRRTQDTHTALADEVQASISAEEWQALLAFNTYCSNRLRLTLEFYRTPMTGTAAYRFRPSTDEEEQQRAEAWIEDHL